MNLSTANGRSTGKLANSEKRVDRVNQSLSGKTKILMVDDNEANLLALEEVLRNPDYDLVKVNSGREALQNLLKHSFAVILMDVQMPEMDGFETARLIRGNARTRSIPVIFLTAKALSEEDMRKGYAHNAVDYILKPFNPDILRTKVGVFVELQRKTALLQEKIEEEHQAREELARTARRLEISNRDLRQFTYVISHDLQEPLRMVSKFVQLLSTQCQGERDEETKEYIRFAADGAHRMQEMIKSILRYSRVNYSLGEDEWVDLDLVLDDVLSDLRFRLEESGATVTRESLPRIRGNRVQIGQVFLNLLTNSIKYRSERPLEIHISEISSPIDEAGGKRGNGDTKGFVKIGVRDNGIGIPAEDRERIFLIFQRIDERHRYPGTGMGLAICKRIVEKHDGRIWVEPIPGGGATFFFTFWEKRVDGREEDVEPF